MISLLKKTSIQILILIVAVSLVYLPILQNGFVLDDHEFIYSWETLRTDAPILPLLQGDLPPTQPGVYRPVRSLLYLAYTTLFGTQAFWYHLHSIVVMVILTLLCFSLFKYLQKRFALGPRFPFLSALLFGLHPMHTEAICYLAASMEMPGIIFALAALCILLRSHTPRALIGTAILSLLAYATYEMTYITPLLFLLLRIMESKKGHIFTQKIIARELFALLLPLIVVVGLRMSVGITTRGTYLAYSWYHTQLIMQTVFTTYLRLLVIPRNPSYLYTLVPGVESFTTVHTPLEPILAVSFFDLSVLGSVLLHAGLIYIGLRIRRRIPILSLSIFWFYVSLLPVSYILPQGIAISEKYVLLASLAWCMALAWMLTKLLTKKHVLYGGVLTCGILLFYAATTWQRSHDWRDAITFWEKTAQQHPQSALAHYSLGVETAQRQDFYAARKWYEKTLALHPGFSEAAYNLALIELRDGHFTEGCVRLTQALAKDPDFTPARHKLAELAQGTPWVSLGGVTFSHFPDWKTTTLPSGIHLTYQEKTIDVSVHTSRPLSALQTQYALPGASLLQEGPANVPSSSQTRVQIWERNDRQVFQFFLPLEEHIAVITVLPADAQSLCAFDHLASTLRAPEKRNLRK